MFNNIEEFEELDESLQADFDKDFEREFGPTTDDTTPITIQQFKEKSIKMQKFVDEWRRSHGV